ncbi:MAG: DUF3333 domain-containing protein, partial [Cohaesibacter sp.]|nr:DUF3333 domain-containing protein [Cohaesibacter sp.]
MTDLSVPPAQSTAQMPRDYGLKKRYASEARFKLYGMIAIGMGLLFLTLLFVSIITKGYTAFEQTKIQLSLTLDEKILDPAGKRDPKQLAKAIRYNKIIEPAFYQAIGLDPKDKAQKADRKLAKKIISRGAAIELRDMVLDNPDLIGTTQSVWILASGDVDSFVKGQISRQTDEKRRQIKDKQIVWIDALLDQGIMDKKFNSGLFTFGASSRPETAGIGVAVIGSLFMMGIVLVLALPIGVAASIYLEEFAPKNKWTDLIEVNINNLAAVPSIVFGLLGLAVFI